RCAFSRRIRCCRIVWISHWSSGREIVVAKRLFFDKFRIFAELGLDGLRKKRYLSEKIAAGGNNRAGLRRGITEPSALLRQDRSKGPGFL
ncbi:hypothetical protein, partial [Alistipes putredinis]